LDKRAALGEIVSRPAFAMTTAIYGRVTAPKRANHLKGLGRITVRIKQRVRIIMEMKYLFWRPERSLLSAFGALVTS
jgi:hypothetical protein